MAMRRSCVGAGVHEVVLRRRLPKKLLCNRSVKRAVTQVLRTFSQFAVKANLENFCVTILA